MHPVFALWGVFGLNAAAIAIWLPRIPDVKDALGLDLLTLSFCLLAMPIGTLVGLPFAANTVRRVGLRKSCILQAMVVPILFLLPGFAGSVVALAGALFAVGLAISVGEVSINAMANALQRSEGRRIMSRCHALWSFGAMGSGLIGGALSDAGVSVAAGLLLTEPIIVVIGVAFAWALPRGLVPEPAAEGGFRLPTLPLLVVCLVPIGALMIEGAMLEWSVLFLRDTVGTTAFAASVVFAVFNLAMGLGRFSGDWTTERLGVARMMILSGTALGLGTVAFALSTNLPMAAMAALLVGYGAANIYPLALSMAPDFPGQNAEANVATVVIFAWSGFLFGPPLIGFIGSSFGLWAGILSLAPIGILPVVFATMGLLNPPDTRT